MRLEKLTELSMMSPTNPLVVLNGNNIYNGNRQVDMSTKFPIHLFSLPGDIYVLLDNAFRKKFFQQTAKLAGSRYQLAKMLNVSPSNIYYWAKNFCPLYIINSISKKYGYTKLSWFKEEKIEKHIINLRGKTQPFGIKRPKLPIKLTPKLACFLGHLFGDGGIKKRDLTPMYCNIYQELINEFIDSSKVFGKLDYWKSKKNKDNGLIYLILPTVLGAILVNNLKLYAGKKSKNKTLGAPSFIRDCRDKKIICSFLRAMFDDECHVNTGSKSIKIELANRILVKDLKVLLGRVGIRTSELKEQTHKYSKEWYVEIYNRFNFKVFAETIGFTTYCKKERLLDLLKNSKRESSPYIKLPDETRIFLFENMGKSIIEIKVEFEKLLQKPFPYITINQWYNGKRPMPLPILNLLLNFSKRKLSLKDNVEVSPIANCRYKLIFTPTEFQNFLLESGIDKKVSI